MHSPLLLGLAMACCPSAHSLGACLADVAEPCYYPLILLPKPQHCMQCTCPFLLSCKCRFHIAQNLLTLCCALQIPARWLGDSSCPRCVPGSVFYSLWPWVSLAPVFCVCDFHYHQCTLLLSLQIWPVGSHCSSDSAGRHPWCLCRMLPMCIYCGNKQNQWLRITCLSFRTDQPAFFLLTPSSLQQTQHKPPANDTAVVLGHEASKL